MISLIVLLDVETDTFGEGEEGEGESPREYRTYRVKRVDCLSTAGPIAVELKPDAPAGPYQVWKVIRDLDNDFTLTLEAGSI